MGVVLSFLLGRRWRQHQPELPIRMVEISHPRPLGSVSSSGTSIYSRTRTRRPPSRRSVNGRQVSMFISSPRPLAPVPELPQPRRSMLSLDLLSFGKREDSGINDPSTLGSTSTSSTRSGTHLLRHRSCSTKSDEERNECEPVPSGDARRRSVHALHSVQAMQRRTGTGHKRTPSRRTTRTRPCSYPAAAGRSSSTSTRRRRSRRRSREADWDYIGPADLEGFEERLARNGRKGRA
jgi:hypothetical protein